jgi:hypothetical protein
MTSPTDDLTPGERARFQLRAALRERMLDVWRERSRDAIEATDEQHVADLLDRGVMPILDKATDWG